MSGSPITTLAPTLTARTINLHLPADFDLMGSLPPSATVFTRGGEGLVGLGIATVLSASGPNRMADLASQWRELCEQATQQDPTPGPGRGLVGFGSIAFSAQSAQPSILVVPKLLLGVRDGRAWLTAISDSGLPAGEPALSPDWKTPSTDARPGALRPGQFSSADFVAAVKQAVEQIHAGKLEKVVLARDLVAELPEDFDLRPILQKLSVEYPSCWTYQVGGQFGASPELLVRVSHSQVSARVLAGTAGRGTDPGVDRAIAAALAGSHKNTEEHKFAVASLVDALRPYCSEINADAEPFSLALPNVWHLASDVTGILKAQASVLDLAQALHPTAAVAGTPTAAAISNIEQLEPFDRGGYAGPVGWIDSQGEGEWAIALRGGRIDNDELRAFAGCGIVAESDPAAELAETELKFQPIRSALASLG